jgi:manganese efflux pump family protein
VGIAALITWMTAVLAGLYMLAVWLIENDDTDRHPAARQVPPLVIFTHLLLAVTGLVVWGPTCCWTMRRSPGRPWPC